MNVQTGRRVAYVSFETPAETVADAVGAADRPADQPKADPAPIGVDFLVRTLGGPASEGTPG